MGDFHVIQNCIESMLQGTEGEDAHGLVSLVFAAEGFYWQHVICAANAKISSHLLFRIQELDVIVVYISSNTAGIHGVSAQKGYVWELSKCMIQD